MAERNTFWEHRLSRRQVLVGAAGLGVGLVGIACGTDNKTGKDQPSIPEKTPVIRPEKVAIWSNEDFEPIFKRLEKSESREIQLINPEDTLPFYYRSGPLRYFVYYDAEAKISGTPLMWVFSEPQSRTLTYSNVFIYDDEHFPTPVGARTYDIFGQVVAEGKLLSLENTARFGIEEVQYIPEVGLETPVRKVKSFEFYELDGEVSFRARSQFSGGGKVAEAVLSGVKNLDYYFMWPTPMNGMWWG